MHIKSMVTPYWFQNKKYLHVGDLIDRRIAKKLADEYLEKSNKGEGELDDQCPKSRAWHGQPKLDWLMVETLPVLEVLTGLHLLPTYTYLRVYRPGEILEWHRDRAACEISVTLNLGQSSDFSWPIWVAHPDDISERKPLDVKPTDAVIYRGCEVYHWREQFNPPSEEDYQVQVFMHYVDKFGPHSNLIYDGRKNLKIEKVEI